MKSTTRHQSHEQNAYSFGFGLYVYKRVGKKKVLVYSNPDDPPARAWIDFLYAHSRYTELSGFTSLDITNTSRSVNYNMVPTGLAAVGETNKGVVLGTGSAPPALSQYSLGALVAHGTGSGLIGMPTSAVKATRACVNGWTPWPRRAGPSSWSGMTTTCAA